MTFNTVLLLLKVYKLNLFETVKHDEAIQKPKARLKVLQIHATKTNRPDDTWERKHVPRS